MGAPEPGTVITTPGGGTSGSVDDDTGTGGAVTGPYGLGNAGSTSPATNGVAPGGAVPGSGAGSPSENAGTGETTGHRSGLPGDERP